jgi:NADPH-dependent 2,4-dienoyl-CoA reductase/sulfur reductase-like enzyme
MPAYKYLIIGGGMTSDAAVSGIKAIDPEGTIGLISAEHYPPYNRPPLTKGLWKGKPLEKIFRKATEDGVDRHLSTTVKSIDPRAKVAVDENGVNYNYERLLLATGGSPIRLPFGGDEILYYRTLDDYHHLRSLAEKGGKFAVIGGGFIGSEITAALRNAGDEVVMAFPEEGISARLFPADLSHAINEYYREKGVEVLAGELVNDLERRGDKRVLKMKSGKEVEADYVVGGIGIRPNTALADAAGIQVERPGIPVDKYLRTNEPDIYAAGDVAYFYNPILDQRLRVEHEDNALTSGEVAGRNMAGEPTPYEHLSYFYSDLFELGYEAVGELNPELESYADWEEPYRKGVIYYLQDGRVRGVLLWDIWGQVDAARRLISEPGPFDKNNLKGRLPEPE